MPVKKTEAQKQAGKAKKKEQLQLKKEQKQKELFNKYKKIDLLDQLLLMFQVLYIMINMVD